MPENTDRKIRTILTSQFGELEIEPKYIFHFEEGLLGFEDLREFVLITDEETIPFKWLISIEYPDIGFPLLNPWLIDNGYSPNKNFNPDKEAVLVVITLGTDKGLMTANMKAPIILDIEKQIGKQVILPTDKYSTFQVLKTTAES